MAKNRKTVHKNFTYLQCDDFAAYLSKMAAEGWHFKEWRFGLVFEKGEPENAVYAVEVFINGTNYDMRPGEHTLNFAEYCEAAGWKLIDARTKFCIFKQIRADAVEIVTQEERLQNATKAYSKNLRPQVFCAVIWILTVILDFFPVSDFIDTIFSSISLLLSAYWIFYFMFTISKLIWFWIWKKKAKKRFDTGEARILRDANETPWNVGSLLIGCVLMMGITLASDIWFIGFTIAIVALSLLLALLLNKFRPDATTNFGIMIAFTAVIIVTAVAAAIGSVDYSKGSDVPKDLVPVVYNATSEEIGVLQDTFCVADASIFGSKQRCNLTYENADFSYDLYKTEQDWLLEIIWDYESSKAKNLDTTDCTALWDAETAFQNHNGEYYIRCKNAILILDLGKDMTLSIEQVAAVRSALRLE